MLKLVLQISAIVAAATNLAYFFISGGDVFDENYQIAMATINTITMISYPIFFVTFAIWIGKQKDK